MIPTPIRLTDDELTVLARLMALPIDSDAPPEALDALAHAGTRSLVARDLIRVGDDSGILVAEPLQRLAAAVHRPTRMVLLGRSDGAGVHQSGRVLVGPSGDTVVQEPLADGVSGFTPLDPDRVTEFLLAVFDLAGDRNGEAPPAAATAQVTITDGPAGVEPEFPNGWEHPVLNSIVRADPDAEAVDAVSWVREGTSTWLCTETVPASPHTRLTVQAVRAGELVRRVQDLCS